MAKKINVRSFLCGMLLMAVMVGLVPTALAAAGVNVTIFPGITVYIDDQKLDARDGGGNPIEIFTLNGYTYLPVRVISEALNKTVQWDGNTRSVYIGRHSDTKPAVYLKDLDYFAGTEAEKFYTIDSEKDNTGAPHSNVITRGFDRTYILNGGYSRMTGTLYQTYDRRSYSTVGLNYYNRFIVIGDGKTLYEKKFDVKETGIDPIPFDIDLTDVARVQVIFQTQGMDSRNDEYDMLSLGEVALYT